MPRIAEIKVINNEVWVRLPLENYEGSIQLWTPEELEDRDFEVINKYLKRLTEEHFSKSEGHF